KAARVVQAIEEWAVEYTRSRSGSTPCGPVVPQAQVGAVRGGIPWRPNRSAPYCALYVDVRTRPEDNVDAIINSLRGAVDAAGVGAEVELVMSKSGAVGAGVEPLVASVRQAHELVRGEVPPAAAEQAVVSMWRDTNVFNRAGIPAIDFGPGRGNADVQGRGYLDVGSLVDAAKMYALVALKVSGSIT
ncbi:MAG: peptidase dimerization domain-containing protein, partial [Luteitalea sp.]|nr:peptidase dimerization domain-containing protein [Luteitalea sp.]